MINFVKHYHKNNIYIILFCINSEKKKENNRNQCSIENKDLMTILDNSKNLFKKNQT